MFFHTIIILMSGSTSKGEWKEPWHNGNMHNIEDFPFFILLLLLFFTYSYIRPSIRCYKTQTICFSFLRGIKVFKIMEILLAFRICTISKGQFTRVFSKIKGFAQTQFLPKIPYISFLKALVVRH